MIQTFLAQDEQSNATESVSTGHAVYHGQSGQSDDAGSDRDSGDDDDNDHINDVSNESSSTDSDEHDTFKRGSYPIAFKQQILSKFSSGQTVSSLCDEFDLNTSTVRSWIQHSEAILACIPEMESKRRVRAKGQRRGKYNVKPRLLKDHEQKLIASLERRLTPISWTKYTKAELKICPLWGDKTSPQYKRPSTLRTWMLRFLTKTNTAKHVQRRRSGPPATTLLNTSVVPPARSTLSTIASSSPPTHAKNTDLPTCELNTCTTIADDEDYTDIPVDELASLMGSFRLLYRTPTSGDAPHGSWSSRKHFVSPDTAQNQ